MTHSISRRQLLRGGLSAADIASHVIQLVAGLVRDGTIPESRIDQSYARVNAFAGD